MRLQKEIGSTVKVQGFIENLRNSKYMAFIVLKDITGKLQITVEKADHPELVDTIDKLTPDSVITVTGKVMENDYVKMGGVEMIPESHRDREHRRRTAHRPQGDRSHQEKEGCGALQHRPAHRLPLDRPAHRREPADVQGTELLRQRHASSSCWSATSSRSTPPS